MARMKKNASSIPVRAKTTLCKRTAKNQATTNMRKLFQFNLRKFLFALFFMLFIGGWG